jgi:hypothetical protein
VTISRTDSRLDRERFDVVDVDEHNDDRRCPVCGRSLGPESLATPDVPPRLLSDATLDVSARARVCRRHRVDVVALEPAPVAPKEYTPVDAEIDGEPIAIAVPKTELSA